MEPCDLHNVTRQNDESAAVAPTLELDAAGIGCPTLAGVASPTSSQGSWVVDPDDGWDGRGTGPTHMTSFQAPPQQLQLLIHHQQQQEQQQQQQSQLSPRPSPTSSTIRSWASVECSSPAVEYPAIGSPPSSPGSSVSRAGSIKAADEGLVALARNKTGDEDAVSMDTADALNAPELPVSEDRNARSEEGTSERGRFEEPVPVVGCTPIDDVDMVDIAAGDSDGEPFVIAVGMTPEEAVEAVAEEAELDATDPPYVPLGCVAVSPPRRTASSSSFERVYDCHQQDARTPPRNGAGYASSSATAGATADGVAGGAVDVDSSSMRATIADTSSRTGPLREPLLPMPACVPLDVTVDGMVDCDDRYENHYENHYDDGKQMDRLWRWTGLITAAKMGVIPIIVCATVAALSTQTSGGSGNRGGRTSGGGAGGGGRGGGGGTRCHHRRSRPLGGGGSTGCFPDVRADRSSYGCMPMPYCVAPSVVCA